MFRKILIANRGEIAVRVARACREMGIPSVAVYSEADRASLHIQLADEAVLIGPAPAAESYLDMDRIVEAVRRTGAEAVHPGYGFLAENADFARRLEREGIVFIGPNADALELVGDKVRARRTMEAAGVPIIPGMKTTPRALAEFEAAASALGYPVIVKASAGGGGKGMRVVREPAALGAALEAGRREAKSAFGDETVYLERYLDGPRHVEFQVLADRRGAVVHLFERECSIQRRHQKIVEESPSPALDPALRATMGETAVRAMKAAGYDNAGTVEFLLDAERRFYFLEVNARLQVEHPVTELVTGVDLVRQQIRIAAGEPLGFGQASLTQRGHAIECRVYAEDPARDFLPSSGRILHFQEPRGPGIRHDGGIYAGWDVPIFYDPILAKLIVWAEDRSAACDRMIAALGDYALLGVRTTVPFLRDVIAHPAFREGRLDTGFIGRYFDGWTQPPAGADARLLALAAAAYADMNKLGAAIASGAPGAGPKGEPQPWATLGHWRMGGE
jgi:acetyl-CoA carboxylase biotin carboxylase subunit